MTRGELIFETSRTFGLDDTVASDELILMQRWYSRGVVDVLLKTHCYVDIGTLALSAGFNDYRLDASVLAVDNITLPDAGGTPYELEIVNMVDLLPYLGDSVAPGSPLKASIDGTLLRVAPAPSSAVTLTYVFVPAPTTVPADGTTVNDAIDPSNPSYGGIATEYHDCLLSYMAWRASVYDDKTTGVDAVKARQAYEGLCKDVRKENRRKAGRGLHAGRVGYPSNQGPSSRNDVYPEYTR